MKPRISTLFLFIYIIFPLVSHCQDVYTLWEGQEKPYYKENNLKEYEKELYNTTCVFDITEPTLTVYRAEGNCSGQAVVIIPGGGYELVALYHEGYELAELLAKEGITAAVLKYRLPNPESSDEPQKVRLSDARRAIKLLRENAEQYGVNKTKVGVVGFSAGSHLSAVMSLWESEDPEENPEFSGLIYGVTILSEENLNWLEESLYYRKLTDDEMAQNNLIELVTENTPPAFLVHAYDDDICKIEETTLYAQRLFENNVKVEMHMFHEGGHGFGIGRKEDGTDQWVQLFINWINLLELL